MTRQSRTTGRDVVAASAFLIGLLAVALLSPDVALIAAPSVLLFFVLNLGFMPGESLIDRFHRSATYRARPQRSSSDTWDPLSAPARPSRLRIAFVLAVRPPPLTALT